MAAPSSTCSAHASCAVGDAEAKAPSHRPPATSKSAGEPRSDCHTHYATGIKVSKGEFDDIQLVRNELHGQWNYTISPFKNKSYYCASP